MQLILLALIQQIRQTHCQQMKRPMMTKKYLMILMLNRIKPNQFTPSNLSRAESREVEGLHKKKIECNKARIKQPIIVPRIKMPNQHQILNKPKQNQKRKQLLLRLKLQLMQKILEKHRKKNNQKENRKKQNKEHQLLKVEKLNQTNQIRQLMKREKKKRTTPNQKKTRRKKQKKENRREKKSRKNQLPKKNHRNRKKIP